jgi:hypothetical protein
MYDIEHCFICRQSDSTVSENAEFEPRTVALRLRHWLSDALTTRLDLIHKKNKVIHKPYFFLSTFQLNLWGRVEVTTAGSSLLYIRDRKVGQVSNTDIPTFPHECQFFVILICSNMKIFSDTTKHIWFSDGRNRRFFKTSVSDPWYFGMIPVSADPCLWLWIRILLFSPLVFKTPTKN